MALLKTWLYDECSYGNKGVDLYDDHLCWWESENWVSPFAGGGASDQTFEEFLQRGPWIEGVPPRILAEVKERVLAMTKK